MANNSNRKAIEFMVQGALPPHSTNVLWMDTSVPELPVLKIFENGAWTTVHTGDSKAVELLAETVLAQQGEITELTEDIKDKMALDATVAKDNTVAKQGPNPDATLSELQRMVGELEPNQEAVAECYEIAQEKGLTVPAPTQQTLSNLPAVMEEITPAYQGRVHITLGANVRAITNSIDITEVDCIGVIFHLPSNSTYAFGNLQYIRKIKNLIGDAYSIYTMFNNSPNLEWVDMVGFDCSNVIGNEQSSTAAWLNTNSPSTLKTLVGDRTYEEVVNNNISILTGLKADIRLISTWTTGLNHATIRAIINGLGDLTGGTAKTITLGVYIAMLTQEEIEIATNKNWNVTA